MKFKLFIIGLVLFLVIVVTVDIAKYANRTNVSAQNVIQAQTLSLPQSISLDKDFTFLLPTSTSNSLQLKYKITQAQLQNQAVVSGQMVKAVNGKVFLIISLKLENDNQIPLTINAKDYLRLIIGNDASDQLAADFYSDPVDVQPISTKFTKLGFVVPANSRHFQLKIGEISGNKQNINLNFKQT